MWQIGEHSSKHTLKSVPFWNCPSHFWNHYLDYTIYPLAEYFAINYYFVLRYNAKQGRTGNKQGNPVMKTGSFCNLHRILPFTWKTNVAYRITCSYHRISLLVPVLFCLVLHCIVIVVPNSNEVPASEWDNGRCSFCLCLQSWGSSPHTSARVKPRRALEWSTYWTVRGFEIFSLRGKNWEPKLHPGGGFFGPWPFIIFKNSH